MGPVQVYQMLIPTYVSLEDDERQASSGPWVPNLVKKTIEINM